MLTQMIWVETKLDSQSCGWQNRVSKRKKQQQQYNGIINGENERLESFRKINNQIKCHA